MLIKPLPLRARPQPGIAEVDPRLPGESRLLVACMPKSGSTFLCRTYEMLPGMRRGRLVPGYKRREQELCIDRLNSETERSEHILRISKGAVAPPRGWVAQHHVRYSEPTAELIRRFRLTPVVLVRNIFDIVPSVRDHFTDQAPFMSMAYVSEEMRSWPEARMHMFIADMVIPWYLNFFRTWQDCDAKLMISYEELISDKIGTLQKIADYAGLPVSNADVLAALGNEPTGGTRLNKGVRGRGEGLADEVKDRIRYLASYYSDVDMSLIGL